MTLYLHGNRLLGEFLFFFGWPKFPDWSFWRIFSKMWRVDNFFFFFRRPNRRFHFTYL